MTMTSKISCPPRYGTQRTPERETLGPAVGEVAKRLGRPFMPWQQLVADVLMEIDPDTGRLAYSELCLTVPRQSGKSTFILAKTLHRASATKFFGPHQRIVYTAQTRKDARKKWEDDYTPDIEGSRYFGSRVKPHWGNGNEHMKFPNGSKFALESTTEKAGHGGVLDEAFIDEAFAQVDSRTFQAFEPAMLTRVNTLISSISTAGWLDGSPFLEGKVRRGRAQVEMGVRTGLCYFEWSAPQDADPSEHDVWRDCMPALGRTIPIGAIQSRYDAAVAEGKLNEFRRAYLNQWVPKMAEDAVIPPAAWEACAQPTSSPVGPVVFSVDVSPERTASIAVVGKNADGRVHAEVDSVYSTTRGVVSRLMQMVERNRPLAVMLDPSGPAGALLNEFHEAGLKSWDKKGQPRGQLVLVSGREMAQACGALYDSVTAGDFRHLDDPLLNTAVFGAKRRTLADAWAWTRKDSLIDISPLVAVTIAAHGYMAYGPQNYDLPESVW